MEFNEFMHGTPPYFKPNKVGRKSLEPSRGACLINTKSGLNERATFKITPKLV